MRYSIVLLRHAFECKRQRALFASNRIPKHFCLKKHNIFEGKEPSKTQPNLFMQWAVSLELLCAVISNSSTLTSRNNFSHSEIKIKQMAPFCFAFCETP